jgi:hypothetical protein
MVVYQQKTGCQIQITGGSRPHVLFAGSTGGCITRFDRCNALVKPGEMLGKLVATPSRHVVIERVRVHLLALCVTAITELFSQYILTITSAPSCNAESARGLDHNVPASTGQMSPRLLCC